MIKFNCETEWVKKNKGCHRDAQHQGKIINLLAIEQLIKKNLHLSLEEAMGPLTNKQQQLVTALVRHSINSGQ